MGLRAKQTCSRNLIAFAVLCLLSSNTAFAQSDDLGLYGKLKLFRTYFVIKKVTPPKMRFDINFLLGVEPMHVTIETDSAESIPDLKREDFEKSHYWGGIAIDPSWNNRDAAPIATPSDEMIGDLIRKLYPGAGRIRIRHAGTKGTVTVQEIIPASPPTESLAPVALISDVTFLYDEAFSSLTESQDISISAIRPLKIPENPQEIDFLDFIMPPEDEGKALIYNPDESDLKKRFEQSLLKHLRQRSSPSATRSSAASTLDSILSRQPGGYLPRNFSQRFILEVQLHGRHADFKKQLSKTLEFIVPLKDLLEGKPGKPEILEVPSLDLSLALVLIGNQQAELYAIPKNGEIRTLPFAFQGQTFHFEGTDSKLMEPQSRLKFPEGDQILNSQLTLGGVGEYTRIDLSVRSISKTIFDRRPCDDIFGRL